MSTTFDCDEGSCLDANHSSSMLMDEEDTDDYYMGSRQASSNPGGGGAALLIGGGAPGSGVPSPYGLTLTIREALVRMRRDADSFRDLTCTSQAIALAILKHYSWSLVRARDSFFDARDAIFSKLHIADDETCQREPQIQSNSTEVTCAVCWDDCAPSTAVSLVACNHWMCKPCAHENCVYHVKKGGDIVSKRCPSAGCHQFAGEALFRAVLSPAELTQYEEALVREYLAGNALMRWCANPKGQCNQIICVASNRDTVHEVRCFACGTRFCFNCGDDAHGPATCEMLRAWRKKAEDDSETVHWVAANTKTCPKCKKGIEKNGGCNHMVCSCKHEWCWVCEGDWSKHGSSWYQCNFYDPKANKDKDDHRGLAKESLQRYIFYFTRYANHLASQKLDSKVLAQVQKRINDDIATNKSGDVAPPGYLEDTAKVLFDCRHTLMYTYVYAYHLSDKCQKQLFEYQQAQLEHATEELSMVIEGSKVMVAQAVVDKTATARQFHLEVAKGVWSQDK